MSEAEKVYTITTLAMTPEEQAHMAAEVATAKRQMQLAVIYAQLDAIDLLGNGIDLKV